MKQTFKNTKMICTIGPKSESKEMLSKLVDAGMNCVRCNFSHGDHAEQKARMDLIREINKEKGTHVAVLLDTKGPEIRTHLFENGGVDLVAGQTVRVAMNEVLTKLISCPSFSTADKYILERIDKTKLTEWIAFLRSY